MSRRDQITMDEAEALAFLQEERVMTCATLGARGWPHLMPLWYVLREDDDARPRLWAWTYAKSQKALNLERDPRATVQVEAGGAVYEQLRGIMLETDVVLHRDAAAVEALGLEIFRRYHGNGELAPGVAAMVADQAPKRVGLEFVERRRATWDHRKLGSGY